MAPGNKPQVVIAVNVQNPKKGGYYGEQPSLTNLDDGNLQFTTDFRSVYATGASLA